MTSEQEKTIREKCVVQSTKEEGLPFIAKYGDFEAWGKTAEDSIENLITHMRYYEVSRKE